MNWGRTKTILIILFLVVNIVLLTAYIALDRNANTIRKSVIDSAVSALSENGIGIESVLIRSEKYRDYRLNMVNLAYDKENAARQLLGDGFRKISDAEYGTDDASVHISNAQITYRSHRTPIYFAQGASFDKADALCERYLKALGFDKNTYFMYNKTLENGMFSFEIMPRYKAYKVEGIRMKGTADKNGILSLAGNWFYVNFSDSSSKETFCNVTSVLLAFLYSEKGSGKTISGIDGCYYIPAEHINFQAVDPIPVYIISCSDGSVAIYSAKDASLILKTI